MKTLTSTLVLTLFAIALSSPAIAQDTEAKAACKPGSTSGKCLLQLITTLNTEVATLQGQNTTLQGQVTTLQTTLNSANAQNAIALGAFVSVNNGAINGLAGPHIIFSGANVHVQNGAALGVINGLGNLIVGSDDDNGHNATIDAQRTGSHNLIVGDQHRFTSINGFVAGFGNAISAMSASVSGGTENAASAIDAAVSGGDDNTAGGFASVVSGGENNSASGISAVVSGGANNTASSTEAAVSGGNGNTASAALATVSGGESNTASSLYATVGGGECNTAGVSASGTACSPSQPAEGAVVSGGIGNLSSGQNSSLDGGADQTLSANDASQDTVLQGQIDAPDAQNAFALGAFVSVNDSTINGLAGPHIIFSGANLHVENGAGVGSQNGLGNLLVGYDDDSDNPTVIDAKRTGSHNLVVGDQHRFTSFNGFVAGNGNTISGENASVSGGAANIASAEFTAVSGGASNTAGNFFATVSGGANNTANGPESVVSGGSGNTASDAYATVSGGESNTASAQFATVSGGECNSAGAVASGNTCTPSLQAEGAVVSGGTDNLSSGENSSVGGGSGQTESTNDTNLN